MPAAGPVPTPAFAPPLGAHIGASQPAWAVQAVGPETRRWCGLAVGSLVIAGLLSLAVVLGRLPVLSGLIDDPLFFKRCLVTHVNLALAVWFYSFLAALVALGSARARSAVRLPAFVTAVCGVAAMLAGSWVRGAQPILANYVPVIDHPLFAAGLGAFFGGMFIWFLHALISRPAGGAPAAAGVPPASALGFQAAAVIAVIAGSAWISARAGLPAGLDPYTRAEFLAWGPGHVLQAANTCAMLAVWLWLLARVTGEPPLSARAAGFIYAALIVPQCAMPLLTVRGTLDPLYHSGATLLMRWSLFPAVVAVAAVGARHLRLHRRAVREADARARAALAALGASAALCLLGMILGACIRGSTTLVPAHYHASLGAVTVSFMAAVHLVCEAARREGAADAGLWRAARRQIIVFGWGQTVFVLGFAIGGLYGLGRKTYGAEQHVRSAGEVVGLVVMGAGGLLAVAGGVWFLCLALREMRGWLRGRAEVLSPTIPTTRS